MTVGVVTGQVGELGTVKLISKKISLNVATDKYVCRFQRINLLVSDWNTVTMPQFWVTDVIIV